MKRLLASLVVTPLALVALGGPAVAGKPDSKTTHVSEGATYAHASWEYTSGDTWVEGGVSAVHTRQGPVLVLSQVAFSEDGTFTETSVVDEQAEFTLTMDRARLTQATLHADDVPVQVCVYEDPEEGPDCTDSTVDISLAWTGEGPLLRSGFSAHFSDGTMRVNTHGLERERQAEVEGAITGAVTVDEFSAALMVKSKFVEITRCLTVCEQPEE
jgi:hypothetical protein